MQQRKAKDSHSHLTRRDFHRLTVAALGGAASGSLVFQHALGKSHDSELLKDPNVCCGLNTCKGHGKGDHECAGRGSCATAEKHGCQGQNDCSGQGGCGAHPGENGCKGQGSCAVPLSKKTWKKARANFEAAMKKAGHSVGPAPEGCGS